MRIQCKNCDYKPSEHDSLEGYCMICAAKKINLCEQLQAEIAKKDELIFAYDATRSPILDKTILDLRAEIEQLQAEIERLEEENRWIPAEYMPDNLANMPTEVAWKTCYYVLEYEAKIPKIMAAEHIWLDEGSEVEYYKPIILPEQAVKGKVNNETDCI